MARKPRALVAGGWYHVVNRGNRREEIFRTNTDRRRFLGRLAELPERFRKEIHAFVLMDNHYHLLLRTLDTNLSDAHSTRIPGVPGECIQALSRRRTG